VCSTRRAARAHSFNFTPLQMHFCPPSKFGPPGCLGPVDGNSSVGHPRSSALKHPRVPTLTVPKYPGRPNFLAFHCLARLVGAQTCSILRRPRLSDVLAPVRTFNFLAPPTASALKHPRTSTSSAPELPRPSNFLGAQTSPVVKLARSSSFPGPQTAQKWRNALLLATNRLRTVNSVSQKQNEYNDKSQWYNIEYFTHFCILIQV